MYYVCFTEHPYEERAENTESIVGARNIVL
jgi:hypothetical protein